MEREAALTRLREFEPRLRERGVRSLYLFGSTARGDAADESDLDLLFEHDPASGFSLFTQAGLARELSTAFAAKIDLVAVDGLRPAFRERVSREMIRVF